MVERFKQQPINFGRVSNEQADATASISRSLFAFSNRALNIAAQDINEKRAKEEKKKLEDIERQATEEGSKNARMAAERLQKRREGINVESTPLPLRTGDTEADKAFNKIMTSAFLRGVEADTKNRLEAVRVENPDDLGTYQATSAEILENVLSEVPEGYREQFALSIETASNSKANQVKSSQRTKDLKDAVADVQSSIEDYEGEALRGARFNDPELMQDSRDNFIAAHKELVESGLLTEQQLIDRVEDFDERLNAETQYGGLVEVLETEGEEAAREALLEFSKTDTGLTPEQKEKTTSRFNTFLARFEKQKAEQEREELAEIAEANSVKAHNLAIDVQNGAATLEDLDNAYADGDGYITSSQHLSMRSALIAENQKREKKNQYRQNVYSALSGGPPVDPNDKDQVKAVDEVFDRQVQNIEDPQAVISIAAHTAKKTGVLPTQVRSAIRGLQRSNNPEVVANAAQLYSAINDEAPMTLSDMSTKDKSMAEMVSNYINAGADPVEAVEIANSNLNKSEAERSILKSEYGKIKKENKGELDDFIDDDFDGWFTTQPVAKENIQADFDTLTEAYYQNTGDIDIARKAAWSDIKRSWGPSEVNGEKVMTRFPIEGKYGMTPEDTRTQLDSGARQTSAIDFVIELEGGDTLVTDDAGKGLTKFGINISANPDIDVKNLTKTQAAKIYQERYWDAIGADDLPPEMQTVAFDTAVNMGPAMAQKLLKKATTPGEFTKLRKEEYRRIAKNPEKKQFLKGWLARADRALEHKLPEPKEVMVVSDHLTVRGKGRDYAVYTRDERGIIEPMRDSNNNLMRYQPEPGRTKTAREERKKTEDKIKKARMERKEKLAGIDTTDQFNRRSIIQNLESFGKTL